MLERVVKDDQVIILPDTYVMTLWRNIVSMLYMHPTLLVHPDIQDFRDIFIENNVVHESETTEIFIPIPAPEKRTSWLRPQITYPYVALQAIFGNILDWTLCQNGIIVNSYTLGSEIKHAVTELAEFIRIYPKALYEEEYGFIYDFLVRFGIPPKTIEALIETTMPIAVTASPHTTADTILSIPDEPQKKSVNAKGDLEQTQEIGQEKRKSSIPQTQRKNSFASTSQPRRTSTSVHKKNTSKSLSLPKRKAKVTTEFSKRRSSIVEKTEASKTSVPASTGKSKETTSVAVDKCSVDVATPLEQGSKTRIDPSASKTEEDTKPEILIDKFPTENSQPNSLLNGSSGQLESLVSGPPIKLKEESMDHITVPPKSNSELNIKVSPVKMREPQVISIPSPPSKPKRNVVVVVQELNEKKVPTCSKFLEGLDLSKYKLRKVTINVKDCLKDPAILEKYFKDKPKPILKSPSSKNESQLEAQQMKSKNGKEIIEGKRTKNMSHYHSSSASFSDSSDFNYSAGDSTDDDFKPKSMKRKLNTKIEGRVKSQQFVSTSSSSSSSEFESKNVKKYKKGSSSSMDSSLSTSTDSEDEFTLKKYYEKGLQVAYNGHLKNIKPKNKGDDSDKTKNIKSTKSMTLPHKKLTTVRERGKRTGNTTTKSREINTASKSTNSTSSNKRCSEEKITVPPIKKQKIVSKIPKTSLTQNVNTLKVGVKFKNVSSTKGDTRQTQQKKQPPQRVVQNIRIRRPPSTSQPKVFMKSYDSESESSTRSSEAEEEVRSSIPVDPVVHSIASELPDDLGIDCSKEFVQRLLMTIHQVEETTQVPPTNCSPANLLQIQNIYSAQSSGDEEEESESSSTKKNNVITVIPTLTNDSPKVIVQPVNSSIQIPSAFSFMRNKAKTTSPSSQVSSSPSNALL